MEVPRRHAGRAPVFRCDAGRPVYGGGGMTPDVVVNPDTLVGAERELMRLLAAPRRAGERGAAGDGGGPGRWRAPRTSAPPPRGARTCCAGWSARDARGPGDVRAGAPLVDRLLEGRVSEMAFGDSAAFRRGIPRDRQLQAAMEVLRGAGTQGDALARAAARPPRLRRVPAGT